MSKKSTPFLMVAGLLCGVTAGALLLGVVPQIAGATSSALGAPDDTLPHVIGVDDGFIETGGAISPFDDDLPAISRLDPDLRDAMQDAAQDAINDGVDFVVTSGWRSEAYQQSLLDAAIKKYGSEEEARKFVLTPDKSRHVSGNAVDIGYTDADSWLSQHGARYGLCQIYSNEMWHFELVTEPGGECPAQLSDAGIG